MNIDEVDFYEQKAQSPALMHVGKTDGGISIGFAVVNNGKFDLVVSIEDARRLGERLTGAANEVVSEE